MSDPTLSRRAVACPGWRWLAGMRTACGLRVYSVKPPFPLGIREGDQRARPECTALPEDAVPDLGDDLTVSAMLALVREHHNAPHAHTRFSRSRGVWEVSLRHDLCRELCGPTEAAALVAALEAP